MPTNLTKFTSKAVQQTHAAAPAKPGRILRLPMVIERTGLGRSSIYAKMKKGSFPRLVKLSSRAVGFRESDIDQWINERTTAGGAA